MYVVPYQEKHKVVWNDFVTSSKNGNFLFNRNYMDYHSDRFVDRSLLFFDEKDKLFGLMPCSIHGDSLISHGGLTYGGIVSGKDMKASKMVDIFDALQQFAKGAGYSNILYKAIPHIYHSQPAEEDLYALFVNKARLVRRDISSIIYLPNLLGFSKGKYENIKRSRKANVVVSESTDFHTYFDMGKTVLLDRHKSIPVHTSQEMIMLVSRFPNNIKLYASFAEGVMLAGVLLYIFNNVVHTQYMFNSNEGLEVGALDAILDYLINDIYKDFQYFSFGISTEGNGLYLNKGLIQQKEMFGARSIVQDFYDIRIS